MKQNWAFHRFYKICVHYEQAIEAIPKDHPERPHQLQKLGQGYANRYQRARAYIDLKLASQLFQQAIDATQKDHPERALRFECLSTGYHNRYRRSRAEADLELAIQHHQRAIEATPTDNATRAGLLQCLGIVYLDKYRTTEAQVDFELSIQHHEQAIEATPKDHPKLADRFLCLGTGYYHQYQRTGAKADLELAIRFHKNALCHTSAPSIDRLQPIDALLALYCQSNAWSLAYEAVHTAVSLVPLITPRSLEDSDKQYLLAQFGGLATKAAAISLNAGKSAYHAIELLELARNVIINSQNEMRLDLMDLPRKYPQLAHRFENLQQQLNAPLRQVTEPAVVIASAISNNSKRFMHIGSYRKR
jgi:hypothetical protein